MLFGYPAAAVGDNWFHNCLIKMLSDIHSAIERGCDIPSWPDSIPVDHRKTLRRRYGLKRRLIKYAEAFEALVHADRLRVNNALADQNQLNGLYAGLHRCQLIQQLPVGLRQEITEIFDFSFKLLTALGIRDKQYRTIYDYMERKDCPFCGLEALDAPGSPREDLDHYLSRSIYPFAAVNLFNLVPMGGKCNQRYKGAQNVLRDPNGTRRRVFNPYATIRVKISLLDSCAFRSDGGLPRWVVDFDPKSEEAETWDNVLSIRKRYQRDVLDEHYTKWIRNFADWFRRKNGTSRPSVEELEVSVGIYVEGIKEQELTGRDAMRAPVFECIKRWCNDGDERFIVFLGDLISGTVTEAA